MEQSVELACSVIRRTYHEDVRGPLQIGEDVGLLHGEGAGGQGPILPQDLLFTKGVSRLQLTGLSLFSKP
jgi:hypothetical protein